MHSELQESRRLAPKYELPVALAGQIIDASAGEFGTGNALDYNNKVYNSLRNNIVDSEQRRLARMNNV